MDVTQNLENIAQNQTKLIAVKKKKKWCKQKISYLTESSLDILYLLIC